MSVIERNRWTIRICGKRGCRNHRNRLDGFDWCEQAGHAITVDVVPAITTEGAVDLIGTVERELRAAAAEWRNAEELDGRTIRDDFNRIADLLKEGRSPESCVTHTATVQE